MKNKYQEALDRIKNKVAIIDDEKMTIGQAYFRTFPILQELVDKETPMKPIKHICNEDELTEAISFECPRCGKDVDDRFVGCPYCLGKLDWSED